MPFRYMSPYRGFWRGRHDRHLIGVLLEYHDVIRSAILPAEWSPQMVEQAHMALNPDLDEQHASAHSGDQRRIVEMMLDNNGPTCRICLNMRIRSAQIARPINTLANMLVITTTKLYCRRCGQRVEHDSLVPIASIPGRAPLRQSDRRAAMRVLGDTPNTQLDHIIPVAVRADPPNIRDLIANPAFVREHFQLLTRSDNCSKKTDCLNCIAQLTSDADRIAQIERCKICPWNIREVS